MIEKARDGHPEGEWTIFDASDFDAHEAYDIVFSNAALQWMPDHARLVPKLFDAVRPRGALAIQIPQFTSMPISAAIEAAAGSARWAKRTSGCASSFTYHDAKYYYDLLCPLSSRIDLWETWYFHVLPSHGALIDFIRSTGMKPYLDAISGDDLKAEFERDVLAWVEKAYPASADGKILFPFDRLFLVAYGCAPSSADFSA
jgi:trans-aconitate 2-methyltransferase